MSTDKLRNVSIRGSNFGERLRMARLDKGWTQTELAEKLGVSKGAVPQWESSSTSRPRPDTLRKIAELFGVDVQDFLNEAVPDIKNFRESIESGDDSIRQNCRAHFAAFLDTCQNGSQLGWLYWELKKHFPLDKWHVSSGQKHLTKTEAENMLRDEMRRQGDVEDVPLPE